MDKTAFMEDVEQHMQEHYAADSETIEAVSKLFEEYIFGYFRLTPLINDPEISDIRCLAYDNIRIKKKGVRLDSGIQFYSPEEYRSFVDMAATKNQVSVSIATFMQ